MEDGERETEREREIGRRGDKNSEEEKCGRKGDGQRRRQRERQRKYQYVDTNRTIYIYICPCHPANTITLWAES